MLSGEGNAGERWKTTIGLISKKATLHVQHTFLYISLPLFCTTTTWNFQKLPSYSFYGGNVVRVLVHFFFHCRLSFSPRWSASIQSHFITTATKFSSCCSNCFVFLSLAPALCRFFLVELRWLVAYFLFFSVFLFLYFLNLWTWK